MNGRDKPGHDTEGEASVARMDAVKSGFLARDKAIPDFALLHPGYLLHATYAEFQTKTSSGMDPAGTRAR